VGRKEGRARKFHGRYSKNVMSRVVFVTFLEKAVQ
jgi:hypothetical protein